MSGSNLIPLLAFGIPGDIAAALILGAFMVQGINVGPLAFSENPTPLYAIYAALLLANLVNLVAGRDVVPEFLQEYCTPPVLTRELSILLDQPRAAAAQRRAFADVMEQLGRGGEAPSVRAAKSVLNAIG